MVGFFKVCLEAALLRKSAGDGGNEKTSETRRKANLQYHKIQQHFTNTVFHNAMTSLKCKVLVVTDCNGVPLFFRVVFRIWDELCLFWNDSTQSPARNIMRLSRFCANATMSLKEATKYMCAHQGGDSGHMISGLGATTH